MSEAAVHAIVDHMLFPQPIPQSARAGGSARRPRARAGTAGLHLAHASAWRRLLDARPRLDGALILEEDARLWAQGGAAEASPSFCDAWARRPRPGSLYQLSSQIPRARGGCCDAAAAAAPAAPGTTPCTAGWSLGTYYGFAAYYVSRDAAEELYARLERGLYTHISKEFPNGTRRERARERVGPRTAEPFAPAYHLASPPEAALTSAQPADAPWWTRHFDQCGVVAQDLSCGSTREATNRVSQGGHG